MGKLKYEETPEPMSPEGMAEVEIMSELDRLFRELENEETVRDRKEEIAGEIRGALERYYKLFRGAEGAEELLKGYYDRLDKSLKGDV